MAQGHVLILGDHPRGRVSHVLTALIAAALAFSALLWLYLLLLPSPLIVKMEQSGGMVYFSANRNIILAPDDCVTLRWQVDGIRAVYLNDQAQIGSGEQQICGIADSPRLRVEFQDGSQQTYTLNPTALLPSSLTVAVVIALALFLLTHIAQIRRLVLRPRHVLVLAGIGLLVGGLLVGYLRPLGDTIATPAWTDAAEAVKSLVTGSSLVLALLFMAFLVMRDALQPDKSENAMLRVPLRLWGIGLAISLGSVAAVIIAVDPSGMYFGSRYPSSLLLLRGSKTNDYAHLPNVPDVVILGSSRAFTLSPSYIRAQTGLRAYNMAIEGGRIEDILIQVRQMRLLPAVLWIEVQDGLPRQPDDIAARAPLSWLPYMRWQTALQTLSQRLESLLDVNQLAGAIYTARYAALYDRQPKEWPVFLPDGQAVRAPLSASSLEQAILLDIGNIPPLTCEQVDGVSQSEVDTLIQIADEQESAIVFYLSPWHPRYYNVLLRDNPAYQACHTATLDYMDSLVAQHAHVFFLDFSRLERIAGRADETGFFDSQHLTEANSQRLIDHASDTLTAAHAVALRERAAS